VSTAFGLQEREYARSSLQFALWALLQNTNKPHVRAGKSTCPKRYPISENISFQTSGELQIGLT